MIGRAVGAGGELAPTRARVGSVCKLSTSYFAQSHATDDAARHGANCPRACALFHLHFRPFFFTSPL